MESVLGRYRNLVILVGILFLQVLGLAMQVKRGSSETHDTRLIRIWAVGAVTPFERGLVWIQTSADNLWHNYFYLRGVRAENRQLKGEIEQMRLEQVRLNEDAAQARRLQTLLAFKEQFIAKTVAAQVIGTSGSDFSRVIYIDRGEDYHIQRDMAVITADGIVGKVLEVYPSVAKVLLINDQTSGVGVILGDSRLQGVIRGTASGEVMIERVMSDEQVAAGQTVLTSGGDQIFPKGLPVGTVTKVSNGKDLFLSIRIRPAADLSKLEEVLVLVEKQERQAAADSNVRVRAADILAQRLPSVPDKPAADAKSLGIGTEAVEPSGSEAKGKPAAPPGSSSQVSRPSSTAAQNAMPAGQPPGTPSKNSLAQKTKVPSSESALESSPPPSTTARKIPPPAAVPANTQSPADDSSPH